MSAVEPSSYPSLSVADVAALLGLGEETVRRMARRGELRGYKVAGRLRFRQDDVDALAFGQLIVPTERDERSRPRRRRAQAAPARGSLAALRAIEREAESG